MRRVLSHLGVISLLALNLEAAHATQTGGEINITGTGAITVGSSNTVEVNGAGADDGGTVTLTSPTLTLGASSNFSANGGQSSGNGGSIIIENGTLTDITQSRFNATGGGSGGGGNVTIALPSTEAGTASIMSIVNVSEGAENTGGGEGDGGNDGGGTPAVALQPRVYNQVSENFVEFNGITCGRVLTGYDSWPKHYWNCVNPRTTPDEKDGYPALFARDLINGLPATFGTYNVEIFVHPNRDSLLALFQNVGITADDVPTNAGGYTFTESQSYVSQKPVDVNIIETPTLGALNQVQLNEVTGHELGHVMAFKTQDPYGPNGTLAFASDTTTINNAGGSFPCTIGTGPFLGVTDSRTKQPFCTGGALSNPTLYQGLTTNSAIAAKSSFIFRGETAQIESYVQAFEYLIYGNTLSFPDGYLLTTPNGLFHQGYYSCIQAMAAVRAGVTGIVCPNP